MKLRSTYLLIIGTFLSSQGIAQFGPGQLITGEVLLTESVHQVKSADLDGDGDLDLVIRDETAIIWSENVSGAGSFAPVDTLFVNDPLHEFDLGDLDGDGDLDLVVAMDMPPHVAWAENLSNGQFAGANVIASNPQWADVGAVLCRDMNGDTEPDVLFTADGNYVHWCFNDAGSFPVQDSVIHLGGPASQVLLAGDLDLDGDEDQLSINWNGFVSAGIDLAGTSTTWTVQQIATGFMWGGDFGAQPQLLDVDADGDLDLVDASSNVRWARNRLVEDGVWGAFDVVQVNEEYWTYGVGWAGPLGCGSASGILWHPWPWGGPVRWSAYSDLLGTFAPDVPLMDTINSVHLSAADLNGDGANDLIIADRDSSWIWWFPNILPQQPTGSVSLTPFDTLCYNGDPYPLDHATPSGGTWSGFGVAANTYTPSLGTFDLAYTVVDSTTGCPLSAVQSITAIAEPTITLVSGDLADECYVTPVQFAATPSPGAWTAPANSSGIVDRSCAVRPLNGYASYAFLAVNGGNCSAEGTEFNLPGCLLLNLGPDQLLCDNADTLVIGVQGPALGYSGVGGAFDTTTFAPPNSSYGYFYPGHAPGAYALNAIIGGANECPGIDSLIVTVIPAPDPAITSPLLFCVTLDTGEIVVDMPGDFSGAASGTNTPVGAVYPSLLGLGTHAFSFTATDTNQCTTTLMENITVDICDGTLDPAYAPGSFHLSPNPTSGTCLVRLYSSALARITVLDASGRVVQELATTTDAVLLDVTRLDQGCYTVCVAQNGVERTQRLVVY